jgi:hypothetical protein
MRSRVKMPLIATVLAAFMLCIIGPASAITTWDAAQEFSSTNNPNSVWTYGYSSTLDGPLSRYATSGVVEGLDWWNTGSLGGVPAVFKNSTPNAINAFGTVSLPAGDLAFHPGSAGEFSEIMWTAPAAGLYLINATFTGLSYAPGHFTTTDVHILVNNSSVYDSFITGASYGESVSYVSPLPISLAAGDTITFAVGFGSNNNYFYDTTGIAGLISSVPLPSTMLLLGSGLLGLGLLRRKWSLKK